MSALRVRFSPAPSGSLHVGGARTALFNWLFARHHGGVFLVRIEDTDTSRTREAWVTGILETLRWLGLDWDEDPVRQSRRGAAYREAVEHLLATGAAYEAFETPEELEQMHEARRRAGLPPGYDGRARDLTPAQREALRAEGRPVTIRFRTPDEGTSTFVDLVRGPVSVDWATVSDFVIVRADGTPLFFLANAVDDLAMGITHVIRGEDLLDSTHRVLAIRRALGADDEPRYAHLPLILRPDRAKLSKRHGAVAVEEYRDRGYLAAALVNYLALLGWSPPDGREVLDRDELVAAFDLDRVTPSAAIFDEAKLTWLNGEWMRRLSLEELVTQVRPFVDARHPDAEPEMVRAGAALGQERSATLVELAEHMEFLFVADDELEPDDEGRRRLADTERLAELLDTVIDHLERCEWSPEGVDLRPVVRALGLAPRKVMPALYVAVEGRPRGLPLFDSMLLLGRERTLARLCAARARVGDLGAQPLH
jgi:glutamyl-tRNA synthetase